MNKILLIITAVVLTVITIHECDSRLGGNCFPVYSDTVYTHTTDTVVIYKTDTLVEVRPKYIYKHTKDTLYIPVGDSTLSLPIEQKYFSSKGAYDVWISGYEPSLDSIRTFNKIEYRTITNETIKEVYPQKSRFYLGGGFYALSSTFSPYLSVSLSTKRKLLYGANLGLYKGRPSVGFSVQYRIFGK